jgi:acetoin utilization protein AcuB
MVESIMTKNVFKVRMDDTIGTIQEILSHAAFHHLLVVEDHKLVGILSDRDILKNISPFLKTLSETTRDLSILNKRVHQFIDMPPMTVPESYTADQSLEPVSGLRFFAPSPAMTKPPVPAADTPTHCAA